MSSNATLRRILQEQTGIQVKGKSASKRPDLLLLSCLDSRYTLIEFKRPDHVIFAGSSDVSGNASVLREQPNSG